MQPLFDSLSSMLETSAKAALTVVDRNGCAYTRSMRVVSSPFRGQLWLTAGIDETPIDKIGDGAEVSLACVSETGSHVIICGWAVVVRNAHYAQLPSSRTLAHVRAAKRTCRPLVCVTARAAQMWETPSALRPRVFAFSHAEPDFAEGFVDRNAGRERSDQARADALEHAALEHAV